MAESKILWDHGGPDGYKFSYTNRDGKITVLGVSVARTSGPPDTRSPDEKLIAAQEKVEALAKAFAEATGEGEVKGRSVVFTRATKDGKIEAHVAVATSSREKPLKAAQNKVQRLAKAFADAASAGRFAKPSYGPADRLR